MYSVIFAWVSVSKWGKQIKLAQKEENWGSFGGKVQKKLRKKSKFNKHMVFNNHTGWIFSPKIINVRYLISTYGLDFGPKKLSVHCTTIRYCRVLSVESYSINHLGKPHDLRALIEVSSDVSDKNYITDCRSVCTVNIYFAYVFIYIR